MTRDDWTKPTGNPLPFRSPKCDKAEYSIKKAFLKKLEREARNEEAE